MRWGQLRPRGTVRLISRLRRQLPLIGEAMDVCPSSLPFQGRWHGGAVTERSQQICGNLSVSFADSSPFRGALDFRSPQGGTNYLDFHCTFY